MRRVEEVLLRVVVGGSGDHHEVRVPVGGLTVKRGGEVEWLLAEKPLDVLVLDRGLATVYPIDLVGDHINGSHLVALGQQGGYGEADVASTGHGDPQLFQILHKICFFGVMVSPARRRSQQADLPGFVVGAIVGAAIVAVVTVMAIGAVVPVVAVGGRGPVEDAAESPVLPVAVERVEVREHGLVEQPGPDDEECPVHIVVDDPRVRDDLDRRAVDDDDVVLIPEDGDRIGEAPVGEQLNRVRRDGSRRKSVRYRHRVLRTDNHIVHIGDDPSEIVAKARLRRADKLGERAVAQVAVDGQNTLTLDGKADGQVGRHEGLARARVERSDGDDLASWLAHHELEVGAEHPERLVDHIAVAVTDHDGIGSTEGFPLSERLGDSLG